ncbi:MAG: adenylate/guanylate cyclase domain-containing protein [Pseudomonadota bacterium]
MTPGPLRRFAFRHFQSRLLAIILLLVLVLQALVFVTVGETANRSAMRATEDALQVTLSSLKNAMEVREGKLKNYSRLLSHDFAFKSLVSESDHDTLLSAFASYRKRLSADWMFVLDIDGNILADTLQPKALGVPFKQTSLIEAVQLSTTQETTSVQVINGRAFQVVVVPLKGPVAMAWVGIGFEITDFLAGELQQQTHTLVNLAWHTAKAAPVLFASTLEDDQRHDFLAATRGAKAQTGIHMTTLGGMEYVAIETALHETAEGVMVATLQRSLDEALAPYRALRWQLLGVFLLSTVLAAVAAVQIARRVTRPVQLLAAGAQRISAGHYETIGDIGAHDELGELAASFDDMVRGLIERDKVRAMLGKVVSPAIAEELLSQSIDFGGQEQEVSVLFSDIRGFTTLCEGRPPSAILAMLNDYLATVSDLIDERRGVVDKYIGDAVMALFGAPVWASDDPQRAIETALAMVRALPALNAQFARDGWPPLAIGIGIHNGIVVAGNIGSATRLNYTVLGDTVNLASRLEGLCKMYGVTIIVSESLMRRCSGVVFRELDRVRVKGKREPVAIFEALGLAAGSGEAQLAQLRQHAEALAAYRARQFEIASRLFESGVQDSVTQLYRARCARLIANAPAPDWEAIETLDEK